MVKDFLEDFFDGPSLPELTLSRTEERIIQAINEHDANRTVEHKELIDTIKCEKNSAYKDAEGEIDFTP